MAGVSSSLRADGTWQGSDGCNGLGGRWVAGSAGEVLAVSGGQTLVGCADIDVGARLTAAAHAGFDGAVLVLFGADGRRTGELERA